MSEPFPNCDTNRLKFIQPLTGLLSKKVAGRNYKFENLGNLEDVALDLSAGEVLGALVLDGAKATLVPSSSFIGASADKRDVVAIDVDKATFKKAPPFGRADLGQTIDVGSLTGSFNYFRQSLPSGKITPAKLRSGKGLIHLPLVAQGDIRLGIVEDLMIDLPKGQAVFLVIRTNPVPDPAASLYLIPPWSVEPDTNSRSLVLRASKADFERGERVQGEFWMSDAREPDLAAKVYERYRQALAVPAPPGTKP
jgi:sporulation protein YlmC with PRC-barrel domain